MRKILPEEVEYNLKFVSGAKLKSRKEWDGLCIHCKQSSRIKDSNLKKFERICVTCKSEKMRAKYLKNKELYKQKSSINYKKYGKTKRHYYINRKSCYKYFDKKYNLELCDYTIDELIETLQKPCTYCTYPASGLDRIDNDKGHTKQNTVPCCTVCNRARMDHFSFEEMLVLGKTIKQIKDNRKK